MRRAVFMAAFVGLVVCAAAIQVRASSVGREALALHAAAGDTALGLNQRLSHARSAVKLRPDVLAYRQREAALRATRYIELGAPEEARLLLIEVWGYDRDNTELRAQLGAVNRELTVRDSRKAHVLHGREGPKGELEPEDLLP